MYEVNKKISRLSYIIFASDLKYINEFFEITIFAPDGFIDQYS